VIFHSPALTFTYPLSLHVALPIFFLIYNSSIPMSAEIGQGTTFGHGGMGVVLHSRCRIGSNVAIGQQVTIGGRSRLWGVPVVDRSEEHTSELQSRFDIVCRLLLEK